MVKCQFEIKKEWRSNIYNSSKGLSYKLYQEAFELEKYLDFLPHRDSIIFYRFRTGNQILQIETDRWLGLDRQSRYCNLCQCRELGDVFHFLLSCKWLDDKRKQFWIHFTGKEKMFLHFLNYYK